MRFVTAAYGAKYRRWSAGMLSSFKEFNPGQKITVYTDYAEEYSSNMDLMQFVEVGNRFSGTQVQRFSLQFTPATLRWVKLMALGHQFLCGETDVCWIDCDMLVTSDLSNVIQAGHINAPSYGMGGRMRDCGGGLVVSQENYYLSGLFSIPTLDVYLDFMRLSLDPTPMGTQADQCEHLLSDQPKLNHLIAKHSCYDLNDSSYDFSFGPWGGHIKRSNQALASMKFWGDCFVAGGQKIGMIPFLSSNLQSHIDTGFRTVRDDETRSKLASYYS